MPLSRARFLQPGNIGLDLFDGAVVASYLELSLLEVEYRPAA